MAQGGKDCKFGPVVGNTCTKVSANHVQPVDVCRVWNKNNIGPPMKINRQTKKF